jgi:predicted amidophosphoribosyltransferase
VGLTARERLENVSGAFQGRPKIVKGKSILVIDDVITSGATIDACAAGLRKAGAKEVYGLSLARAVLSNSF